MQANLTSKSALLLVTVLSSRKQYMEYYWLFYTWYRECEWLILTLLQFSLNWITKGTFSAIVYRNMMIIVHFICMFLIFPLSLYFSQIWNQWSVVIYMKNSEQSKNYIKFHFHSSNYISIWKFIITMTSNERTPKQRINSRGESIMVG